MELLSSYGNCIFFYKGNGKLYTNADEWSEIECSFSAGQLNNGKIILLCHGIKGFLPFLIGINQILALKFEGKTNEGFLIKTNPVFSLHSIPYLPHGEDTLENGNIAFSVPEITVEFQKDEYIRIHFGITNLNLSDYDNINNNKHENDALVLNSPQGTLKLKICKVPDYDAIFSRLSTLREINITGIAILDSSPILDVYELVATMNDVCFLLSLKQGTKVVWIYFELYNAEGVCISRTHKATITRDYHPLDIFYFKENEWIITKEFLQKTYPFYLSNREALKLNKGTIDTYLDAKSQHDFLEIRSAKISIAIEKLKFIFLKSKGSDSEFVILPDIFAQNINAIESCVNNILQKDGRIDKTKIQMLVNRYKISDLNRRSFRNILKELSKDFKLNFSNDEISLFVSCRNSLVHNGDFYYRTADIEERKRCEPLPSIKYEYFFLVNMLDRIFLRVVGYDDTVIRINWRKPPERIVNWLNKS